MFTLEQLVAASGGRVVRGAVDPGTGFPGGTNDSRDIRPGEVFFALSDQRDGHAFVAAAFANGAAGAVVERVPADAPAGALLIQVASVPHALRRIAETLRAAHPIPMVGITGSMGKTTTKDVLAAVLGARYRVLRTAASYNNEIGVPLTLLRLEPTHEVGVIELGFYVPGEIADLCALVRPRIGIITAIPDRPPHFSRTPSLEAIANGKAELIAALPTAAAGGVALLNADDPRVRGLAGRTAARLLLYGESDDAAVRATDVHVDGLDGISFQVAFEGVTASARLPLPGRHLLTSALASLGAAVLLGVPLDEAAVALGTVDPPVHRMQIRRADGLTVIDDSYNASEAAVHAALALLRDAPGRRIAVLGDMLELGTLSAEAHEAVGRDAAASADILIAVGDLAATIAHAAGEAGMSEVHRATDAADALVRVRRVLAPGDVVLVKGSRALALDRVADALVRTEARA